MYLKAYNLLSAFGWFTILCSVFILFPFTKQPNFFWSTRNWVTIVQTGAILEIIHSLLGFVKSPILTTVMQVSSRLLVVIGIFQFIPESTMCQSMVYLTLLMAWSITEIVRYLYYYFSLVNKNQVPYILQWLRYNMFIVLYPMGVTSELIIIFSSLAPALERFGYPLQLILAGSMLTYIPGLPILFNHMLKQRSKFYKQTKLQ